MKINFQNLEKKLKTKFKNQKLLVQSLTHKSFNPIHNNEKLEFLGDRVLGLVISKNLIKLFPDDSEGDLDKKLASLVNKSRCSNISKNLGIGEFIIISDKKNQNQKIENKILSDAMESLIGAIYIDNGFSEAEKFILYHWKKYLNKNLKIERDPKTKLQELSLKRSKTLPIYKLIENKGPRHKPIIKVSVKINSSKVVTASGSSKKEAEQKAALILLKSIKS
tara:strand:+ start:1965 stop:2630 length:666 start_codon:yes stop_codon:yes gene_type:complete